MKIELDYDNKLIKLENKTELKVFIETIQKILPDWEKWTLDTNTIINWSNPITITTIPYIHVPRPWWEQPYVYYGTDGTNYIGDMSSNTEPVTGKYQIEVK